MVSDAKLGWRVVMAERIRSPVAPEQAEHVTAVEKKLRRVYSLSNYEIVRRPVPTSPTTKLPRGIVSVPAPETFKVPESVKAEPRAREMPPRRAHWLASMEPRPHANDADQRRTHCRAV